MRKEKDNNEGQQEDKDMKEIFENLGEDLSELLGKLADEGAKMRQSGQFGFFQDLEDMMSKEMDLGIKNLEDIFKNFSPQNFGPGFDTDTAYQKKKKRKEKENIQEPSCDIFEEAEEILILIELPGVSQDDISIKQEGKDLLVKANHQTGRYEKKIRVPEKATGMPSYSFKNGILRIQLKKESEQS